MNVRLILLIGFLIALSVGCEKEKESKGLITISGITEVDIVGEQIGNVDDTDWKLTDQWTVIEENLFKQNNTEHLAATETVRPASPVLVMGYPNPVRASNQEDMIFFRFQLSTSMYYDMRIVDKDLNIKEQIDSTRSSIHLRFNDSLFVSNQMYRIYYKLYSEDKVYRGHGDFKFVK